MPEIVVDSLDTVEESLRPAYVENEGKFNLDPDKYAEVKAQGLKSKNGELIKKLNQSKEAAKRFDKFQEFADDDLAELLELHEQKKNPPPADPKQQKGEDLQANFDKVYKKAESKWGEEKVALTTERDALKQENRGFKLMYPLRDIASKAGVLPEDLDVAMMETAKHFDLDADDEIVMLDKDGDPTGVTPERFYGELYKEKRPKFYAPSGASGSGAPSAVSSSGGKRTISRDAFNKLGTEQQKAFMAEVKAGKATLTD
jgi:hypothetical protein